MVEERAAAKSSRKAATTPVVDLQPHQPLTLPCVAQPGLAALRRRPYLRRVVALRPELLDEEKEELEEEVEEEALTEPGAAQPQLTLRAPSLSSQANLTSAHLGQPASHLARSSRQKSDSPAAAAVLAAAATSSAASRHAARSLMASGGARDCTGQDLHGGTTCAVRAYSQQLQALAAPLASWPAAAPADTCRIFASMGETACVLSSELLSP